MSTDPTAAPPQEARAKTVLRIEAGPTTDDDRAAAVADLDDQLTRHLAAQSSIDPAASTDRPA